MAKVVRALDALFLKSLPPIPAVNKWLACYPVLCWAVLGSLLHGIMGRVWSGGVLDEILQGADPLADGAAAAAAVAQSEEAKYREKRAKRAARIQKWLSCKLSQCWAACSLFVTASISSALSSYLKDDDIYAPQPERHDGRRPWVPFAGSGDAGNPTLRSQLDDNMAHLRGLQKRVFAVLAMVAGEVHFLCISFPTVGVEVVYEALQSLVFETLADLHLRFTSEYRRWPFFLFLLLDELLSLDTKLQLATAFHAVPSCCLKKHFELKLKFLFPTPAALLSADAIDFITAWVDHQPQSTKPVECNHRLNATMSKAKGLAKPCDFYTVVDRFACSRIFALHSQSLGKIGRRHLRPRTFNIRQHPRVQRAMTVVQKLKKKTPYLNRGLNAKWLYLNEERKRIAAQKLPKAEFYAAVSAASAAYQTNLQTKSVARDKWRSHVCTRRLRQFEALGPTSNLNCVDKGAGRGPWKMGDGFWPVQEDAVETFVSESSRAGGIRNIAERRHDWLARNCIVGSEFSPPPHIEPEPITHTCFEKHPGLCAARDKDIFKRAQLVAGQLKTYKSALGKKCVSIINK